MKKKNKNKHIKTSVLFLDKNWAFINTVKSLRALHKFYGGKAFAIESATNTFARMTFNQWVNYSNSIRNTDASKQYDWVIVSGKNIAVPEIILSKNGVGHHRSKVRCNRDNLIIRDNSTCQYCSTKVIDRPNRPDSATVDHIHPECEGGRLEWSNCVIACQSCNSRKANKPLSSSGLSLKKIPVAPNPKTFGIRGDELRESWKNFIPADLYDYLTQG